MHARRRELHALVLAAGASRRFGTIKQLAPIDGEPLLLRTVQRAAVAAQRTWVILGAHAHELAPLLAHSNVTVHITSLWCEGLAGSIRAGIESLPPSCDGAMLVLADQALVGAQDYARLAQTWRNAPESIAAARFGAHSSAPAIFPRRLFSELQQLTGDVGARAILQRHAREVVAVTMPSAEFDVDTPADLAAITGSKGRDLRP